MEMMIIKENSTGYHGNAIPMLEICMSEIGFGYKSTAASCHQIHVHSASVQIFRAQLFST